VLPPAWQCSAVCETPHSPPNLLAATIFVDGTKSITGSEEGVPFLRMADSFQGAYNLPGFDKVFIEYPRSLGPLTGPGDPTYDASEADATGKIVTAVHQARARLRNNSWAG
jgi:hypothetical protein